MISIGKKDVGKKRIKNEDNFFFSDKTVGILPNLYIIADGMGGHKAGDVASLLAIEAFCERATQCTDDDLSTNLIDCGVYANQVVYNESKNNTDYSNMGTTLICCTVTNNKALIAHVGDSRAYLINNKEIKQITSDHSLVQEMVHAGKMTAKMAKESSQKNIITKAIGSNLDIEFDLCIQNITKEDKILLCSDGLHNMVSDDLIFEIVNKELEIEKIVDELIEIANDNGGYDNISVVLIDLKGDN